MGPLMTDIGSMVVSYASRVVDEQARQGRRERGVPGTRATEDAASRRSATILGPVADVDESPLDGGCGGHLRGDEVGATAASLASLEVAVRGGGAALPRLQDVGVHAEAHRAAGHPPVEARLGEDPVEALDRKSVV